MNNWTDKSVKYLKKLKEETNLTWDEITDDINEQFGFDPKRTINSVRKTYKRYQDVDDDFTEDLVIKNIQATERAKHTAKQLRKTNKIILEKEIEQTDFKKELLDITKGFSFKLFSPPVLQKKKKTTRTLVAHIADTHIGCNIKSEEMGGINEYTPEIAARRFASYFQTLAQYKPHHRDITDLVVVLNGDIFAGVIHSLEGGVLPMAQQFKVALEIFSQGLSFISNYFQSVKVIGLSGNHDRYMHKDNKGRQVDQKWDSFATNLYDSLEVALSYHKNVSFEIPKTPYALFKIQGHQFFSTHGDSVINIGNPGKSINTGEITKQINNFNAGLNIHIDVAMFAHVHKSTFQTLDNGCELVINGTLSGTDPFAQSIGILSNNPVQQIFEVTNDAKVGDMRFIRLAGADKDKSLDKIIKITG